MGTPGSLKVAVLLATYNGSRFVGAQIKSLKDNCTPFTLHWLDDHSTDDTRQVVRACAREWSIDLQEWHQPGHLGPWIGFYELLERVEADIYLFCDQDDLWQPGKIDVTVANLLADAATPALCFSDPLMFRGDVPAVLSSTFKMLGQSASRAIQESRLFMSPCAFGHTQGFTRAVREIYLGHKEIARAQSMGHDWWMYLIAVSCGTARMLFNVPTTLYRRHGNNFSDVFLVPKGNWLLGKWRLQQLLRQSVARQASGFVLASPTLPRGPKLEWIISLAKLVATVDRKQSPAELARLTRLGTLWPGRKWAIPFATACLLSDAVAGGRPQSTQSGAVDSATGVLNNRTGPSNPEGSSGESALKGSNVA